HLTGRVEGPPGAARLVRQNFPVRGRTGRPFHWRAYPRRVLPVRGRIRRPQRRTAGGRVAGTGQGSWFGFASPVTRWPHGPAFHGLRRIGALRSDDELYLS